MSHDDYRASDLSNLELALCILAVCGGGAAAVYLYLTVHWVTAVVITVYLLILLMDICLTGQQSVTWYLLNYLHHLLSFAGTAFIASYLWRTNGTLGTLSILPVFVLLLAITHFLMIRLYRLTPSGRAEHEAHDQHSEPHEPSRRRAGSAGYKSLDA